ncbi:MAG: hypothetical protein C4330_01525 [Chitinophagaceae bacterium]
MAGVIIVVFQLTIIVSGNLSFLNWLSIIPALACFNDGFWAKLLPKALVTKAAIAEAETVTSKPIYITSIVIVCIIGLLSIQPAINILSPTQIMNTSFDPFDLVNTYGAFGIIGK